MAVRNEAGLPSLAMTKPVTQLQRLDLAERNLRERHCAHEIRGFAYQPGR
jgi:hypothetical protein